MDLRESSPLLPKTVPPPPLPVKKHVNGYLVCFLVLQFIEIGLIIVNWLTEYHLNASSAIGMHEDIKYRTNHFVWDILVAVFIKLISSIFFFTYTNRLLFAICTVTYVGFLGFLVQKAIQLDHSPFISTSTNLVVTIPVLITVGNWFFVKSYFQSQHDSEEKLDKELSLGQLLRILKPYFWPKGQINRIRAFSTYLMLILSKMSNLIAPLYMARATNALTSSNGPLAIQSVLIYCTLAFTCKILKELQSFVYLKVSQTAYIELAEMTYRHLQALSMEWHLKKKLGDTLRSMDRGVESANMLVSYLFLYLVPAIAESVVVVIIFSIHFQLATLSIASFGCLVLYAVVTIQITLWRKKFREQTTKHDNDYHDKATDTLINFETVKYFTNEEYEVNRYTNAITKYQKYTKNTKASLSLLNSSQALIVQTAIALALIISIPHILNKDHGMDIGGFIAVSVYLTNLIAPLNFLGSIYNTVINAFVDMRKLSELLFLEPDVRDCKNAPLFQSNANGFSIELRDVHFNYPDQDATNGLQGVSFTIDSGTTTALVGHTGSGKTTISRLLFRFYDIQKGQILFNHQDIALVQQKSLRQQIGIVPQDTVLFNDTILYNVQYGNMSASLAQVEQCCQDAQILDFILNLPEKWDTKVGERGLKLSGGEKQRIAIARTLLKDPPFVILDEATSALDTETEFLIQKALGKLRKGRTMLVIAHRLSTVRNADQIIVLESGKVLEKGSHDDLFEMEGKYKNLWKAQLDMNTKDLV